jgi:hypothetical protein
MVMCSSTSRPWATRNNALAIHRIRTCQEPSKACRTAWSITLKRAAVWTQAKQGGFLRVGSLLIEEMNGK